MKGIKAAAAFRRQSVAYVLAVVAVVQTPLTVFIPAAAVKVFFNAQQKDSTRSFLFYTSYKTVDFLLLYYMANVVESYMTSSAFI